MKFFTTILAVYFLTVGVAYADPTLDSQITKGYEESSKSKGKSERSYSLTLIPKDAGKIFEPMKKFSLGPRPGKWCGWFMRSLFGGGAEYNRAAAWAKRGSNAGGPQVGAVVVWPHHVGLITGRSSSGQWLVKSGNDGGRVRERPRSVAGAIAFRIL